MTHDFDNIQPARMLIWFLKFCGMWTFENKWWNPLYRIYGWLLHFNFTFLIIAGMYINVGTAKSLRELTDGLYMSLTETALIVKVLNSMLRTRKIVEILQILDCKAENAPNDFKEMELARTAHKGFCRLRDAYIVMSYMVLLSAIMTPVYDKTFALPFPCWIPFDYRNPQMYYYAYSFVIAGMAVTTTSNVIMDMFFAYLMFQLSINFKFLCNRFKEFGNKGKTDEKMLNEYFEYHSFLSRLTKNCEDFMSLPVFVQLILSAFVLCFTTYRIQNITITDNPHAFLKLGIFAIVMAFQIYLFCNYGNELTASANDLTNAIYSSNWTHLPLEQRKKIFIFMECLKRPTVVKAGKIFNVDLELFTQTMSNAYRLYAVLLNIST